MPTQFQRPENLSLLIPIYHTVPRDNDADLLLKITALETNKTAVFPVFKEDMVEFLPNYFGVIFDKNKKYKFKENRLQNEEYFEIRIPNLKNPNNFAFYLYNFVYSKIYMIQKLSRNRNHHIDNKFDHEEWLDFYWIANYFGEEGVVKKVSCVLSKKYRDLLENCSEISEENSYKIFKKISLEQNIQILSMAGKFIDCYYSYERSVIVDNLWTIANMTHEIRFRKRTPYIESRIQAVIDAGFVPILTRILVECSESFDKNLDVLDPCVRTVRNLMAGTFEQTEMIVEQKDTIIPLMLPILEIEEKKFKSIRHNWKLKSILTDIHWIIGEISRHSDQIEFLLDNKIMPAIVNRFGLGRPYGNEELFEAARTIDKFIFCGSFPQIVQILDGDDCIKYLFNVLDESLDDYCIMKDSNVIRFIINIIKNLLIKHKKNQQLIKSISNLIYKRKKLTADDMKKHGLVDYDLLKKIDNYVGIDIIRITRSLDDKKITKAADSLLKLYSEMKREAEREAEFEEFENEFLVAGFETATCLPMNQN